MANEIYNFLKQNNLTQKSEQDFIKEYSNPDKAKELHGFLQQNNLTKKDSAQFYDEYFKPQTLQQPAQTTTNGIGVLKNQLPFKAVTDFNQSIVDKVVPQKNTENNPIVGIGTPMEKKKQEPKLEMVYSATEKQLVPKYTEAPKTSAYDVANAMSTEQLLTANNDVFKTVVNQANGDTGLDEFNKQSDKNNNIQAFNRESELYNVRLKTLKDRAGQLERVLASKYQTPDFMQQVKSQMATVKQKSAQYDAYVQSRSKEVIALQTELEAIVEQGKAGTQPIEVLKPAYDAKKAQLDAIQRDDEQKRSEIEQLQNDFNGKLDDPDFALYSQIYDKINELSGEQQGLISKPEFAEYRKLLDEGDKAQAKKDAMKKAYQSKGILGKAVDIYAGIGMATNPAAYFLDNGEQVDKTFIGAKIADEGDKLLGRTLKALKSIPKQLENINPLGDANKYDYFDAVFDQAIYASKKRDMLNPTATDVQRDIIQKYADVDGYKVMLDENGTPTSDVRDSKFYKVNEKIQKEIFDKYRQNPSAYETQSDFGASTLATKATPTILDMGTMMATAMLTGGTTGLVAGAGTAGTVSTATTVGVSAAQMYGDMYESGLTAGLTPQEANDFATLTSIMTGMVSLVNPMEANIVKGTASKSIGKFISNSISKADVQLIRSGEMSIGQYAKRMAKEGVKNTFGENLEELVLEPAVQRATETYYNTKAQKNGQQGFEDLNKPFFDTKQTIETAMITSMTSLLMTPIEVANSVPEQRKIALQNALDNPQQFLDIRQKMLEDGDIEKGKFDYEVKAFEEISKQYNTVKPNIKEDLHDDLAELLLKKYTLKNTMSQVNDEVLNKKNQLLLDDINKRLEEVADGTYNKGKEKALSNIANPNTLIDEDKIATYNGAEVTILDDLADGEVVINTNNPEIGEDGIITVEKSSLTDVRNKPKDIEQLQITNAVININGKEYEGKNHAEAILKAQADGQDISQVDRQAEGLFKLSDGTIINREQAKEQFGQDRSELIIPQDEASNQANVEYKRIQDEQKNPIAPIEPINAGQELNNGTGIQQVNGNGGEIQQGDGIGQVSGQEVPTEKVEENVSDINKLEEEYNSKSVDDLVALKKKLYPNPDIESAMSAEEKLLNKVIAKKYSDINAEIALKRKQPISKTETTENPALRDVESTAKALEKVDTKSLKTKLGVDANWDMIGEGDLFDSKSPEDRYTQRLLSEWYRASQKGEINPNSKITYDIVRGRFGGQDQKDVVQAKDENGIIIGVVKLSGKLGIEHIAVAPEFRGKGVADKLIKMLKENNPNLDLSKTELRSKGFDKAFGNKIIAEAYHKAKADGSNPELVKAVEEALSPTPEVSKPVSEVAEKGEGNIGIEDNYNSQIEEKGFADVFIPDDLVINGVPKNTYKVRINKDGGIVYYDENGKEVGKNKRATKDDFILISKNVVDYFKPKEAVSKGTDGTGQGNAEGKPADVMPTNAWGSKESIDNNFYTKDENGFAVKIPLDNVENVNIDGIDFHVSKVDGDWKVIEKNSGLEVSTGKLSNTKKSAIEDATYRISNNGGANNISTISERAIKQFTDSNLKLIEAPISKTETTKQKLKTDKHDRMVGLMHEYNSTPTNKKTRKSEIRQSINKLASDLGYTVKGKTGDKIDILNAKGKVIRKINITSDEVTVTPEVIEKTKELAQGWFEWNGNELDYHIDAAQLGLTWQEIRRAKADLDAGKTESTNINRVANAINEYGNMESLPLVRGFGGNYERIDVTGEDLFWAQKVNEGAELLSEYENIEADREQALKEITETDEKEFEQYSDLYAKFVNEDGLINWEEALKYNQDDKTTTDKGGERQGSSNDIGDGENSQQVEKEKRLTKTEQARLDIENIRKEIKDNSADDFNLFAVFDPKREAQRQYNSHVLLVKLVKAYINLGVASINDIATKIGISIKNLRNAFDEATGKKSYTLDDMLDATNHVDLKEIKDAIVEGDKKAINEAYILAQAYLEATDFEYNTEARDEFIEKVRNNPLSKAIFTETQLEKIYDGQVLSSVDKIRIKYKMLIYDIKNNNRLSKQQIQQKQQEMADDIKGLINNNLKSITGKQAEKFINLANKAVTNNSPAYLARIINQIANLADQRTYQKAKTLYEIIKARSKRKGGVQSGKLTGVLQDFATINPLDVSDIAKYVELAEKVKQASNVVKQPTDADSDLVYDEVQAYVKAQQDEINSNAINDTLEDDAMTFFTVLDNKTKAKFGDDKTFDDLNEAQQREVLDSITKDDIKKYGLTDEERDMVEAFKEIKTEQKRQDFITATYNKIGELKDLLANSVGVITQSPAEKEITDALLDVKLDDMTATEMARVLKLINGITQNNDYSGGGAFVAQQKAVESVAKLNALKSEIGTFRNIKKRLAKIANLSSISESMARGAELGAKLKRAIGFSEFTKAVGIAKNYAHELGEQFAKNKFSKFHNSVFKPINQARLTVYASVIQTKIGEEVNEAEHIQNWKEILESNIKNLRKSGNEDNIKEADVLETAISEIIGDANSFADIAMNLSKTNKELLDVHTFFVNAGAEQKPRLRENANLVHNEEIEEYNNYTKLSFTNIITNSKIDVGDSIFSGGATGIVKKKSKSLMDRSNYNNLKDTMKMDLNWINNQFKALASNEYDIQTSKPIETLKAIFNADNEKVREILGTDNFTLLRDRLIRMTNKKIHESTIIDDLMSVLGRSGRTLALGNFLPIGMVASALKQSVVLASTIINNIGKNQIPLDFSIFSRDKRKQENILKLLAQSDIISRRASGAGGFYDTGKIENKISDNIAQKGLKILGEGQKAASDFSMMALRYTDIKAADISWITYYKNYLRKKGLPFDDNNEFKNPNKDAMVYAETMVERSQGANTDVSQADMWEYSKGLSSIFMPFMAFAVQANVRMFNNYHNIYNGKNRGEALKDIAAFNAEIALFNVVKLGISASIVNGLIPLLKSAIIGGDDDDEVEKARKAKQLREGFWQQLAQDHYGIMPLFDDNVTKPIANKLWKNMTGSDVPLIPLYNGDKSMKDGMQLGLFQGAINKYYDISKDLDIMYNNPVFGGFDGMEKEVTEYEYKGDTYKIVHSGGYVSKDMYISNRQEGRFKNIEVPLDVLVDFVNNPSEFKKVKTLAWESASVDKKFKLELDDNQKAFAAFIFAVDASSLMGASDNILNRTNNAMRKELTKKTIKQNVYE